MTFSIQAWRHAAGRTVLLAMVSLATACGGSGSGSGTSSSAEPDVSIARLWNEVLLEAIRGDFARPTIHARNLFHISAAMYDAWAVYSDESSPYLLGNTVEGFPCDLAAFDMPEDRYLAREEAISYAAYRLITYRFRLSPSVLDTEDLAKDLLTELGYDARVKSTDYADGSPAALGNYIASCYIGYGLQDGSNEAGFFANEFYAPVNPDIRPVITGNPGALLLDFDLDRWQPIALSKFIDQSGNEIDGKVEFLSPEWGQVKSFALGDAPKTTYSRDGFDYQVYYDPGMPPTAEGTLSEYYKWGFSLVSVWSSHLDPFKGRGAELIDISPNSVGSPDNEITNGVSSYYPGSIASYDSFYNLFDGGDASTGYTINPATGAPYATQMVPLGDYARVLAEFWADGPASETPPGHWFVILNEEVSDDPAFIKRFEGVGPELGALEWDIKAYFALAGTMHDAAIAAWGIKGWYDYIRPLSAIRAMAEFGQSSDPMGTKYDTRGMPLYPGFIEQVKAGDPLAGTADVNVGEVKVLAWKGPGSIKNPAIDQAGVDWILAKKWWPYQRPSFVTPPFAGYISGHSTYSRAAAELLTKMTGDPYFPGGMSGFEVTANEFLVFEEGPSTNMTLEWATYRDASDQCSLSRIWGGIHPPADDIPGRFIGHEIGLAGFALAKSYFEGTAEPSPL